MKMLKEFYEPYTALDYMVHRIRDGIGCPRSAIDLRKVASNSEIRRWLDQGAIRINGVTPKADDLIEFPITDLVLFWRKDKKRITLV